MRFRLKSVLVATTVASLITAAAAPFFRGLEGWTLQRLSLAVSVYLVSTSLGWVFLSWRRELRLRQLSGPPVVVIRCYSFASIGAAFSGLMIVVSAFFSGWVYMGLGWTVPGKPPPHHAHLLLGIAAQAFLSLQFFMMVPAHGRRVDRFGPAGILLFDSAFFPWDGLYAVEYDAGSRRLTIKTQRYDSHRIACDPDTAERIQALYERSKQPESGDGAAASE